MLVSVQPLNVEFGSNVPVAEGGQIRLWCKSKSSNPAVTILWGEDGNNISFNKTKNNYFNGDFNGTHVHSQLVLPALRTRNGHVVTCTPWVDGVVLEELTKQFVLNVTCKYKI